MTSFGKRAGGGRRRADRLPAVTTGVAITVTRSRPVLIRELSCTGAKLEAQGLGNEDDVLVLKVGNFEAYAIIRWVNGALCGLQFDYPIPKDVLEKVRGEANALMRSPVYLESMLALEDWNTGLAR